MQKKTIPLNDLYHQFCRVFAANGRILQWLLVSTEKNQEKIDEA